MKNILTTIILAMPLVTVAERICVDNPISPAFSSFGPFCFDFEPEKYFELCPYNDCVDECVGGGMVAPCNPMDLCDPGLGCSLGKLMVPCWIHLCRWGLGSDGNRLCCCLSLSGKITLP
ncbi:hypothetical protein B0I37DRAFT_375063 [Chaetomium sp. MPI-CAGE-AT-0009]|nr:hypothetical protein B0I37DRAFT_375063 [Chaetomium sp. MPI-CAGE-AT-0009]